MPRTLDGSRARCSSGRSAEWARVSPEARYWGRERTDALRRDGNVGLRAPGRRGRRLGGAARAIRLPVPGAGRTARVLPRGVVAEGPPRAHRGVAGRGWGGPGADPRGHLPALGD